MKSYGQFMGTHPCQKCGATDTNYSILPVRNSFTYETNYSIRVSCSECSVSYVDSSTIEPTVESIIGVWLMHNDIDNAIEVLEARLEEVENELTRLMDIRDGCIYGEMFADEDTHEDTSFTFEIDPTGSPYININGSDESTDNVSKILEDADADGTL